MPWWRLLPPSPGTTSPPAPAVPTVETPKKERADTAPTAVEADLRTLGYEPEFVRPIQARKGRPGCIMFAKLRRTPVLTPAIYAVAELLNMPGINIENLLPSSLGRALIANKLTALRHF
ncbi:hypothetical protein JYU34_018296 [Plutella xylostella]|uniref:Uncharacterized protein n=1 Tax=Plutella xylostella TaxID=51655 RepID=A0ABQ7Q406_PLUXY|nr:hypothetical protein JYU34_018296 [Plutella xylostella]